MDPAGLIPILILCVLFVAFVLAAVAVWVAAVVTWTAIWLALKLVAAVVFLPPALFLSVCCDCQGPKRAVIKVLWLKWAFLEPSSGGKDGEAATTREGTATQQPTGVSLAALHERLDALRAAQAARNAGSATATTTTSPAARESAPAERDVERGIPEGDPAGSSLPPPPPDMDIADSVLGELAPPSYQSVHDTDEPPPEYEMIESGRHIWGY
ncbi:hypothetical protein PG985_000232 [Apiospora marii]|uniref:Uncharacterized protein n=1 Tax=Apiospora marii TaxID=335849 RepID=A0ABR1R1L4_9PEZI